MFKKAFDKYKNKFVGTKIICPKCHSREILHSESTIENGLIRKETYTVKCKNCGCNGQITETWIYNHDQKK